MYPYSVRVNATVLGTRTVVGTVLDFTEKKTIVISALVLNSEVGKIDFFKPSTSAVNTLIQSPYWFVSKEVPYNSYQLRAILFKFVRSS